MPRKLKFIDSRVLLLATIVAVARMLAPRPTQAQADSWTPPYPMILTAQRALAFVQAADQKLDYVPAKCLSNSRMELLQPGSSGRSWRSGAVPT